MLRAGDGSKLKRMVISAEREADQQEMGEWRRSAKRSERKKVQWF